MFYIWQGDRHRREEVALKAVWPCLDPLVWDCDGDMLPDGWELQYNLSPCECAATNSPAWDADTDGLGLFDEYRYCTSPLNPDTDGDGVRDGVEVPHSPGSCPNDPDDEGNPANCVTLSLTVGDPSGSHSERWNFEVFEEATGRDVVRHCDDGFGTPGSAEYALVKGKAYTFSLRWIGTNLDEGPDYDWQALINDSDEAGAREGLYGTGAFIVEDSYGLLTEERHGDEFDITIGETGRIIVPKVEFLESAGTRYNFSPSLGEEAAVDVKVTPAPPEDGFPGVHFRLGIVRETAGGGEQEIDWLDVDDTPAYSRVRAVDFQQKRFTWNGIPNPSLFGNSAPQASGRDSFQGVSDSAVRILPAVTAGQPVPPPFVTAVAKIVSNSDQSTVCEARKRICIPQVVKLVYDADAVNYLATGFTSDSGVTLVSAITNAEWDTQRQRIRNLSQLYYDAVEANIRFVSSDVVVALPYSTVQMQGDAGSFGTALIDFLNATPSDNVVLHVRAIESDLVNHLGDVNPNMTLPVTPREVGNLWAQVTVHETGHILGLVSEGDVLDGSPVGTPGDSFGGHNRYPYGRLIMNPGKFNNIEEDIGRKGSWSWKSLNGQYLRFVLPKE